MGIAIYYCCAQAMMNCAGDHGLAVRSFFHSQIGFLVEINRKISYARTTIFES
jgi:hypothetical protein